MSLRSSEAGTTVEHFTPRPGQLSRWGADSVTALCAFVVALLVIPSSFAVRALGSVGSFGIIFGLAALYWWCWYHLQRQTPLHDGVPVVRRALGLLIVLATASFARASFVPLPPDELSSAESGLIRLLAMVGIALVANDGIRNNARMRVLINFLTASAALVAVLSIVQFLTGRLWIDLIPLPSFIQNPVYGLGERQGFSRPTGTANHPIELASMLTMLLPLTIMTATNHGRVRLGPIVMTGCIILAVVFSLSRTAMIGLVIGLIVILPALSPRWRVLGGIAGVGIVGALSVAVPGLLGTLRGLFLDLEGDPSVQSRTEALGLVAEFISRSPLIGRGLGTFLPKYWILDNMYLQLFVEIGLLGVLALIGVFATAIIAGWRARGRLTGTDANLAAGVVAGVTSGAVSLAFFDSFAFPQSSFTLFLLVGMAGAYWRIARNNPVRQPKTAEAPPAYEPQPAPRP